MSGCLRVMLMVVLFILAGCGQSGPLYLPSSHPSTTPQNSNPL